VRRGHFEALRPVCPVCRVDAPLAISLAVREANDDLLEGILGCTNHECLREYPVVDGVPVIVGPIRAWLGANPLQLLARTDLSPQLESLIGDVLGPGSAYDTQRQHAGIYAHDHYGSDASSALALLDRVNDVEGPLLDLGCSTGRTTFHLAERTKQLTLGVDLNAAMLRIASRVLREGNASYDIRRVGVVYERKEIAFASEAAPLVDFWCCDASALPFARATFGCAAALNLLDCVGAPHEFLRELARVIRANGTALMTTPYDWSAGATPVEHWLGGHSQRGANRGASEPVVRALLEEGFTIEREEERVPWRVRLHDRAAVDYDAHVVLARRRIS
jgi:SAM-dependent methyltransferase/uncharacterized protein YbaR (Trm112 family)